MIQISQVILLLIILISQGKGGSSFTDNEIDHILENLKSRNQAIIKKDADLIHIYIPLKGTLKCIENLKSFHDKKSSLLLRKFTINDLTTGGDPLRKENVMMKTETLAQGIYLDVLQKNSKDLIVKGIAKDKEIRITGNTLDHKNQEDLYEDFMYCLSKASKMIFIS